MPASLNKCFLKSTGNRSGRFPICFLFVRLGDLSARFLAECFFYCSVYGYRTKPESLENTGFFAKNSSRILLFVFRIFRHFFSHFSAMFFALFGHVFFTESARFCVSFRAKCGRFFRRQTALFPSRFCEKQRPRSNFFRGFDREHFKFFTRDRAIFPSVLCR